MNVLQDIFSTTLFIVLTLRVSSAYYPALFCWYFSGNSLRLIGCHRIEDVKEVLVGFGLQVLRLVSSASTSKF